MGPPGSAKQENSMALAEYFQWKFISTGDLLRREVNNKTEKGARISECFSNFKFVDDEIVIDLVKGEIEAYEKKQFSWIIQGFPRTKVQALALQKMAIIPDKFVHINIRKQHSLARIKQNCIQVNQSLYGPELDEIALKMYEDYEMNMNAVDSTFNQFIYHYDAGDKA